MGVARKGEGPMSLNIPEQVLTAGRVAARNKSQRGLSLGDAVDAAIGAAVEYWEDIRCDTFHPGRSCDCEDERVLRVHRVTLVPAGDYWFWRCICGRESMTNLDVLRVAEESKFHAEGRDMNNG